MENKKLYPISISIISLFIAIISVASLLVGLETRKELNEIVAGTNQLSSKVSNLTSKKCTCELYNDVIFVLKEYNGVIGIFNKNGALTDTINVNIKSLPEQDQDMLKAGIWVHSKRELFSLIEDYTG